MKFKIVLFAFLSPLFFLSCDKEIPELRKESETTVVITDKNYVSPHFISTGKSNIFFPGRTQTFFENSIEFSRVFKSYTYDKDVFYAVKIGDKVKAVYIEKHFEKKDGTRYITVEDLYIKLPLEKVTEANQ